jgi:chemotaxis protein MotB
LNARAGTDRWLLSYADLMTLLFAFSLTMYAVVAEKRVASLASTPPPRPVTQPATVTQPAPATSSPATSATLTAGDPIRDRLARDLAEAIGARRIELIRDSRGLVVSMPDDAAFSTGSAEATGEARKLIAAVGETLRSVPNRVRVEGHTDDRPIRTARYNSNWELSTARASAVVAFLIQQAGIDAKRLSAAGYGEFHPLNPNDSDEHRARNRRVDLVILDADAASTPAAPGGSRGDRAVP